MTSDHGVAGGRHSSCLTAVLRADKVLVGLPPSYFEKLYPQHVQARGKLEGCSMKICRG